MLTDAWKCVSQISPLADMQHQLRGNTAIKNKWPFVFLLKNISKLIDWGRSLHPKTKLKSSSPENYSNSNWSSLIYLLKAKLFFFWPERTLVGEKKQVCWEQTRTSHPEEISTFPALLSSPVSWLFPCSAHIFASLFAVLFVLESCYLCFINVCAFLWI